MENEIHKALDWETYNNRENRQKIIDKYDGYNNYEFVMKCLKQEFNEQVKQCPYWVIAKKDWYDPEGLDIKDNSYNILFGGTEEQCKQKIKDLAYQGSCVEKQGEDFVVIYYPNAISRVYYSIKKRGN